MTDATQVLGRIKSALAFYANEENYNDNGAPESGGVKAPSWSSHDGDFLSSELDYGKRAREALRLLDGLGEVDGAALEAAAKALWEESEREYEGGEDVHGSWETSSSDRDRRIHRASAKTAITAYLSALAPPIKDAGT